MSFRLLVLVARDLVITLSEIAYNVSNNLNEVLLAMVFTVYNGNIFNRSHFIEKVVVSEHTVKAQYPRACGGQQQQQDESYTQG